MLLENILRTIQPQTRETLPDGVNYFLLFLMFTVIIISVVIVIYFAKWLTLGPKVKKRWAKITRKNKGPSKVEGVSTVKGEVVVDANYEKELVRKIEEATSPQEKLDYQVKLESHRKQKALAEDAIKRSEQEKLAKIQEKEERARIKSEAKEEVKRIKQENKKLKGKK